VKSQFLHKQPNGSAWQGSFRLESASVAKAFIHLEVAELEPAGKDTLPGSPHLAELRNGGLGTEVILNGTSLGRLNDRISRKALRESPQKIRLEIPAELLRKGENTWAIKQTPLRKNPQEFDDCEIGPVVLDIEQTLPN
jgi:hypothetical protein